MHKIILIFLTFILMFTNLKGQWEILNEGVEGNWYVSIDFINDDIGWMAVDNGMLFNTEDGGNTWNLMGIKYGFNLIDFLNDSVGWAVADSKIFQTQDGGINWLIQDEYNNYSFNIISVLNEKIVYAIGEYTGTWFTEHPIVIGTYDGGISWENICPGLSNRKIHSVWFPDDTTCVISGCYEINDTIHGILLRTQNGGETWEETIFPAFQGISNVQFVNDTTVFFRECGENNEIFKTEDNFRSWSEVLNLNDSYIEFLSAINKDTIYTIFSESGLGHGVKKTTDGGITWRHLFSLNNWDIENMYFRSINNGFIYGHVGFAPHTSTLQGIFVGKIDSDDDLTFQILSYPFRDVHFIDKNTGFAVGGWSALHHNAGNIFITHDGGNTWELTFSQPCELKFCFFVNENVGFTSHQEILYRTTTRGTNWIKVYSFFDSTGYSYFGNDICFINEQIGWVVGELGLVLRTEDGISWVDQNTGKTYRNTFSLSQNYPNPFNPRTIINYELPITNYQLRIT